MKRKILDEIVEKKGEITETNEENNEEETKKKAEQNQKEIDEKLKQIKSIKNTLKNDGKPVNEQKILKRQKKLTPILIIIYTFIFIFSGLSVIIKIYGVLQN